MKIINPDAVAVMREVFQRVRDSWPELAFSIPAGLIIGLALAKAIYGD